MSTEYRDYNYDENVNTVLFEDLNIDKVVGLPKAPDDTKLVSASCSAATYINCTLSDTGSTAGIHTEWAVKVNGVYIKMSHDEDSIDIIGTTAGEIGFDNPVFAAGDVITISHLYKASGVDKFIDQPVTNNLV